MVLYLWPPDPFSHPPVLGCCPRSFMPVGDPFLRGGRVSFHFSPSPLSQDHVLSVLSYLKQFIKVCPGSWVSSVGVVVSLMSGGQRFDTQPCYLKAMRFWAWPPCACFLIF